MKQLDIFDLIKLHSLRTGDAIELVCPKAGFPKHYAIYLGTRFGKPYFIANISDGVQIIKDRKLLDFMAKYEVTNVERFNGNAWQRHLVVRKAMSRLGEREYHLVFNNCEHFKNWVLYYESKSNQVISIGIKVFIAGLALSIIGAIYKRKGLVKVGLVIVAIPLILYLFAYILATKRQPYQFN